MNYRKSRGQILCREGAKVAATRASQALQRRRFSSIIGQVFRLTREVRFAINSGDSSRHSHADTRAVNGHAGSPPLTGLGYFFALNVTLAGELEGDTSYLINIKQIDDAVRRQVVPLVRDRIESNRFG